MMITEIEIALKEAESWLQNDDTWENELDGLDSESVGMAVVARIRKTLSSAIERENKDCIDRRQKHLYSLRRRNHMVR